MVSALPGEARQRRVAAAVACAALLSTGCPPPEPALERGELPETYTAQAVGRIDLGAAELELSSFIGRVRAEYTVYPDDRVVVSRLTGWINDTDVVVPFAWWTAPIEPLRCTELLSQEAAVGDLVEAPSAATIKLPANAVRLGGVSFSDRKGDGSCAGRERAVLLENPAPLSAEHDPSANRFAIAGSFALSYEGHPFELTVDLAGDFVNRPPDARMTHAPFEISAPGAAVEGAAGEAIDGCPPAKSTANTAAGLRLALFSESTDPDPSAYPADDLKFPRADLQREDWVRAWEGGAEFLGEGRVISDVTFESGREHSLSLTVTDHSGSRDRVICTFFVDAGGSP